MFFKPHKRMNLLFLCGKTEQTHVVKVEKQTNKHNNSEFKQMRNYSLPTQL